MWDPLNDLSRDPVTGRSSFPPPPRNGLQAWRSPFVVPLPLSVPFSERACVSGNRRYHTYGSDGLGESGLPNWPSARPFTSGIIRIRGQGTLTPLHPSVLVHKCPSVSQGTNALVESFAVSGSAPLSWDRIRSPQSRAVQRLPEGLKTLPAYQAYLSNACTRWPATVVVHPQVHTLSTPPLAYNKAIGQRFSHLPRSRCSTFFKKSTHKAMGMTLKGTTNYRKRENTEQQTTAQPAFE